MTYIYIYSYIHIHVYLSLSLSIYIYIYTHIHILPQVEEPARRAGARRGVINHCVCVCHDYVDC